MTSTEPSNTHIHELALDESPEDVKNEEGFDAWLQAVGAFLVYVATWGPLSAYGSYQAFYETHLLSTTSSQSIAWVGTIEGVLLIMGGILSGPIYDRGFVREILLAGSFVTVFGIMMLSLASSYYQVLLAQGICVGIGSGMLYVPSISLVASRFQERRALAVFVATSGTAIGGIIYPIIFSQLQPKIGFGWATRVLGFVTLAELVAALAIILPVARKPAAGQIRAFIDYTAFKDSAFMMFCAGLGLMWFSYWVPFFLLPTFAQFKIGTSADLAFYILVICNASTLPGRYMAVPVSKRFGPAAAMCGFAATSSILFFGWIGIKSTASIIIWAVLIALSMGPLAVIYPIIVPLLTPDPKLVGTRMGMSSAAAAVGTLVGFPVTTALNDIDSGKFWKSQLLCGICMLGGAVLLLFVHLKVSRS